MNGESIPMVAGVIMASKFAGLIVLSWVMFAFMPRWTRPDIYFSVTVRPAFRKTPQAEQLEQRFRRLVALHSLIGFLLTMSSLLALDIPPLFWVLILCGLFWQMTGSIIAFVVTRRHVLPHAELPVGGRDAVLHQRRTTLAGRWLWLGPLLILFGFAIYIGSRWGDIPERFPTHWGATGRPDSWSERSFIAVFMFTLIGIINWMIMLAFAAGLPRFTRRIFSRGAEARREQKFMRITQWILLGFAYWTSAVMGTVGLLPLLVGTDGSLPGFFYWIIAFELILVTIVTFLLARSGQGGWRLDDVSDESESVDTQPVGDRTPDSAWKLGLFYYNPDDPALFVEKRFGIGWDFNWGRPVAWMSLLVLLILPTVIPILLMTGGQVGGPIVVETYPVHGSSGIDPDLKEIRICFDQPMDHSVYSISPGGVLFPEVTGEPRWIDDRTCVVPVRIQSGQMYEVMINMEENRKFRSQSGNAAPSSVIDFSTAATSRF